MYEYIIRKFLARCSEPPMTKTLQTADTVATMTGSRGGRPKLGLNAKKAKASSKLTKADRLVIRKQKRNAVVKRQVAASLATVHERPCLQKEPAVEDIDVESDDENYSPGCNGKLSIEERKGLGMLFATHEEVRIAIKVSYIIEYNEPAESDWASIANDLHARWGIHKKTVKNVFKRMRDGDQNAEKQGKGADKF